jgi:acetoin utilization deacetylase AcuC-like enzyme
VSYLHISYHPIYAHPLPEGHRFPMLKYELIPGQLLQEGTISERNLIAPLPCSAEIVLLTHSAAYFQQLLDQTLSEREQRVIGFPQSKELTHRELIITQGTIDCARAALQTGIALNVAGGTHHAFADRGEGFCLLNDMAIAANYLLQQKLVKQILIIDLDVHQGNGTAKLFEAEPRVFTFSMHGATNYPFKKERSDLDIGLANGSTDQVYLDLLYDHLPKLLENVNPDFVFYLAGVDILETDKFGKLGVTMEGCRQRDLFVLSQLKARSIPCAVALGGGYSADVNVIVEAHCQTFRLAKELFELI